MWYVPPLQVRYIQVIKPESVTINYTNQIDLSVATFNE